VSYKQENVSSQHQILSPEKLVGTMPLGVEFVPVEASAAAKGCTLMVVSALVMEEFALAMEVEPYVATKCCSLVEDVQRPGAWLGDPTDMMALEQQVEVEV
jgi:hypothetical protein